MTDPAEPSSILAELRACPPVERTARLGAGLRARADGGTSAQRTFLDAALEAVAQLADEACEAWLLIRLGGVNWNDCHYRAALESFARAQQICVRTGDRASESRAHIGIGVARRNLGELEASIESFRDALRIVEELDDRSGMAQVCNWLGIAHADTGDIRHALPFHLRCLKLCQDAGDLDGVAEAHNSIGRLHTELDDHQAALESFARSLEIRRRPGLSRWGLPDVLNNMGIAYGREDKLAEARACFEEALELRRQFGGEGRLGTVADNLGCVFGRLGEHDRALDLHQEALEIRRRLADPSALGASLINTGGCLVARGELARARPLLAQAVELADRLDQAKLRLECYQRLADLEAVDGHPEAALDLLRRAIKLAAAEHAQLGRRRLAETQSSSEEEQSAYEAEFARLREDRLTRLNHLIQAQNDELRNLLDAIPAWVVVEDDRGLVTRANRAVAEAAGSVAEGLVGRPAASIFPELADWWRQRNEEVLASGRPLLHVVREWMAAGRRRWLRTDKVPLAGLPGMKGGLITFACDITSQIQAQEDRLRLADEIQRDRRLESLGVLADGLAHEFNNILVGVLGNADLALADLESGHPSRPSIEGIGEAARRATDLCRQIQIFAGRGKSEPAAVDLNALVRGSGKLVGLPDSGGTRLECRLHPGELVLEADAAQIRQLIVSLVTNAVEAFDDGRGTITIRTEIEDCDPVWLSENGLDGDLRPGRYARLVVSDTGRGMDAAVLGRIFEPFFTTKFAGRGMGLSAVQGIARNHGGAVTVASQPGQGSTFTVYLPLPAPAAAAPEAAAPGPSAAALRPMVLLIDDEAVVRSVAGRLLARLGYEPLVAASGEEALEIYRARAGEIGCVLLDLAMPGMDGEATFLELRRIDPYVRVIVSSGFAEADIDARFLGRDIAGFIQKPYDSVQLRHALAPALGPGQGRS